MEIPSDRLLLPIPVPPVDRDYRVELDCDPGDPQGKPVRFAIRGTSFSLVSDPQPGFTYWFIARIDAGEAPWLVDLGDWPQGRVTNLPQLMRASMVQNTPPGFTSAPRNVQIFQIASGAVSNRNCTALYDQPRDRALIARGPHVELVPEHHEVSSSYWVKARVGVDDASKPGPFGQKFFSFEEVDSVIGKNVPFFLPMSGEMQRRFPAARSGWLSIYSGLRRDKTEEEFWKDTAVAEHYEEVVIKGADWFVKNMPPDAYGPLNIGVNQLNGVKDMPFKRWTLDTVDAMDYRHDWRKQSVTTFPHGAKWLADQMHVRGLQLGSWLIADAWDAEDVYKEHPDWFLHHPDGTPVYFGWTGKFFLDGSNPGAVRFLTEEMQRESREWGVDNFWVDGNWSDTIAKYASAGPYFYDKRVPWWEAYRRLIQAIRDGAGPASYIHMDGAVPLATMGIANGSRTAGDPNGGSGQKYGDGECCQDWKGALTARTGTMDWYFLNRTGWYCDPSDAFNVGFPMTLDQAHVWGPLLSLTGQVLMLADPVYELPSERVRIAKALFPSPPVRPVEIYSRPGQAPSVWDLRVAHVGQQWDVIMFINWEAQPRTISVALADLGLNPDDKYLLFDFWDKKSLGMLADGRIELWVPATGSRLVRLTPLADHPEVFGLARHITQGLVDLHSLSWQSTDKTLRGESVVPAGDPYQFWVYVPEGYDFKSARSSAGEAVCQSASSGGLQCMISSPNTASVQWTLQF